MEKSDWLSSAILLSPGADLPVSRGNFFNRGNEPNLAGKIVSLIRFELPDTDPLFDSPSRKRRRSPVQAARVDGMVLPLDAEWQGKRAELTKRVEAKMGRLERGSFCALWKAGWGESWVVDRGGFRKSQLK